MIPPRIPLLDLPRSLTPVDQSKVLDAYLGVTSTTDPTSHETSFHYFIAIDQSGASDSNKIVAHEFHLYPNEPGKSGNVKYFSFLTSRSTNHDTKYYKLGKISPILHIPWFTENATSPPWLCCWVGIRFDNFFHKVCDGQGSWSATNNCQKFTQFLVQEFNLVWPEDVPITNDIYPLADDTNIHTIVSAMAAHKLSQQ
eukprot:gene6533-7566_t